MADDDWKGPRVTRYNIVLDGLRKLMIVFGVLVVGQGNVWFDDVTLDPVGRSAVYHTMVEHSMMTR